MMGQHRLPSHPLQNSRKPPSSKLAYVETMVSKGGKPVPPDANGLDALVEMKYAL